MCKFTIKTLPEERGWGGGGGGRGKFIKWYERQRIVVQRLTADNHMRHKNNILPGKMATCSGRKILQSSLDGRIFHFLKNNFSHQAALKVNTLLYLLYEVLDPRKIADLFVFHFFIISYKGIKQGTRFMLH